MTRNTGRAYCAYTVDPCNKVIYIRVKMLAQSQRADFLIAGAQAVRNELVAADDWALVRQVGPPG